MATTNGADRDRARAVAAAAVHQATTQGVALPDDLRLWLLAGRRDGEPVSSADRVGDQAPAAPRAGTPLASVTDGLAAVLEAATPAGLRQVNGLHVTPGWLVDELVGLALDGWAMPADEVTICDPACGGGAFLLGAARALHARGVPRPRVVQQIWGADVDPVGLATAEAALALWAADPAAPPTSTPSAPEPAPEERHGRHPSGAVSEGSALSRRLVVGDPLTAGAGIWPELPADGFGVVVGNPPFLNQLGRATVRPAAETGRLRQRFGAAVQPYTDTAWLFLMLGCELARDGGRVALVQPLSLVAARDGAAVRVALDGQAELRHLWVEPERAFAANVKVCAPVLEVGRSPRRPANLPVQDVTDGAPWGRVQGLGAERGAAGARVRNHGQWADRLADAMGVPRVEAADAGGAAGRVRRLGDCADVLAGFRDEYYGLVPLVREADAAPGEPRPLVTAGVIDWGGCAWGRRSSRFAKRTWAAPVVDLTRLDVRMRPNPSSGADRDKAVVAAARWVERTAVPKIVVATQTRVVEAAVDEVGSWVPSVPALAVLPRLPEDLWRLAAALASPTATAWLLRRAPETGLSRGALKIAARDLAELPLPGDVVAWDTATAAWRAYAHDPKPARLDTFARAAGDAYGAPPSLVAWWRQRLGHL